jgi:ABC-2 type transport system ATP-binding protein
MTVGKSNASGVAIRTRDLTRDFAAVRALDGVTLEVPQGIVFGLLGPNGAGKTTMIRLLLGLLEPTAGSAEALGFDTRHDAEAIRDRTGALLEHTGLYERLTAEDNLEFYARVWRLSGAERNERIRSLLTTMGLYERRRDKVGEWSRGMKQKLAIARALLHRPALLFLDEPTAGLDPRAAFELRNQLARLAREEGVTVFLTTHNLAEAEQLCAMIAVIRAGRLVAVDSPEGLKRGRGAGRIEILGHGMRGAALEAVRGHVAVRSVDGDDFCLIVELAPGATAGPLVALLVEYGAVVEEVRRPRASLEEIFLALTAEDDADG